MAQVNKVGQKIGRLLVVEKLPSNLCIGKIKLFYKCKCDCGKIVIVNGYNLKNNHTTSCGCLRSEKMKKGLRYSHGFALRGSTNTFYNIFNSLKSRCENPKNNRYYCYGNRGIKNEWKSFATFKKDMYQSYLEHIKKFKNTTLDRINTDGNYCKKNCRWVTAEEQQSNRRNNRFIKYDGKKMTVFKLERLLKLPTGMLYRRIFIKGMSLNQAIKL